MLCGRVKRRDESSIRRRSQVDVQQSRHGELRADVEIRVAIDASDQRRCSGNASGESMAIANRGDRRHSDVDVAISEPTVDATDAALHRADRMCAADRDAVECECRQRDRRHQQSIESQIANSASGIAITLASHNGRFLRHRPKRSERCLNYEKLYQGQRRVAKERRCARRASA